MEDLVCPECGAALTEEQLREALICPQCKTNLRDPEYLDFLELLVYYDIVDDIDFFDMSLYGDEMLQEEREDFDEPEIDPSKFEKRKEVWDEFEDELEGEMTTTEDTVDEEAWDIFNSNDIEIDEDDWEADIEEDIEYENRAVQDDDLKEDLDLDEEADEDRYDDHDDDDF